MYPRRVRHRLAWVAVFRAFWLELPTPYAEMRGVPFFVPSPISSDNILTDSAKMTAPQPQPTGPSISNMHYKDNDYFRKSNSPRRYWMPTPIYGENPPPGFHPTPVCTPQLQRGGGILTLFVTVTIFVCW